MTLSLSRTDRITCSPRGHSQRVTLVTYLEIWKQRRALARLDINALKDLGISQNDARREAARPFWDLPF